MRLTIARCHGCRGKVVSIQNLLWRLVLLLRRLLLVLLWSRAGRGRRRSIPCGYCLRRRQTVRTILLLSGRGKRHSGLHNHMGVRLDTGMMGLLLLLLESQYCTSSADANLRLLLLLLLLWGWLLLGGGLLRHCRCCHLILLLLLNVSRCRISRHIGWGCRDVGRQMNRWA